MLRHPGFATYGVLYEVVAAWPEESLITIGKAVRGRHRRVGYVVVLVLVCGGVAAELPAMAASGGEAARLERDVSDRSSVSWPAWNSVATTYHLDVVDPEFLPVDLEGCASTAVRRITGYSFATPPPATIVCR